MLVEPTPPRRSGPLPFIGAAVGFLRNPIAFLTETRDQLGDTFLLEVLGFPLLFVFSPAALRRLYDLPEEDASFTEATRTLIGLKLPPELLQGDMGMFRHLFSRDRLDGFVAQIEDAVDEELAQLGGAGEFEIFQRMKLLVHKIGFRCWAGREAAGAERLPYLIERFERLDPEQAFVHPAQMLWTIVTRKAPERRALREVEAVLTEIWQERARRRVREGDMLERLHEMYIERPPAERFAAVAKDVMILHLASQSNLYASLAWTLVNLLRFPQHRAAVDAEREILVARYGAATRGPLSEMVALEQFAQESIRVAQRSLTLRKVVRPCQLDDGRTTYSLQPGVYVGTLIVLTNSAYDTLDRFDPQHYERNRLAPGVRIPTAEVVSTFGHGRHACVGERFAIAAIKIVVSRFLERFEVEPCFDDVTLPSEQIGAVARAASPCLVRYRRRVATSPSLSPSATA